MGQKHSVETQAAGEQATGVGAGVSVVSAGTSPQPDNNSVGSAASAAHDDMAASPAACRVSLRESVAKMRWTASSLDSLRSAEDRLLVRRRQALLLKHAHACVRVSLLLCFAAAVFRYYCCLHITDV